MMAQKGVGVRLSRFSKAAHFQQFQGVSCGGDTSVKLVVKLHLLVAISGYERFAEMDRLAGFFQ